MITIERIAKDLMVSEIGDIDDMYFKFYIRYVKDNMKDYFDYVEANRGANDIDHLIISSILSGDYESVLMDLHSMETRSYEYDSTNRVCVYLGLLQLPLIELPLHLADKHGSAANLIRYRLEKCL
jgi:hypothetical protein